MSAFVDALRFKTNEEHHGPKEPTFVVESQGETTVITETPPKEPLSQRMKKGFTAALRFLRSARRQAWVFLKDLMVGAALGVGIEGIMHAIVLAKQVGWMGMVPLGIAGHNLFGLAIQFSPAILIALSIVLVVAILEYIARSIFHKSLLAIVFGVISDLGGLLSLLAKGVNYVLSQAIVATLVIIAFLGVSVMMILFRIVTAFSLLLQTPYIIMYDWAHEEKLLGPAWRKWVKSWKPQLFFTTIRPTFKLITEPGEDQETVEWSQLLVDQEEVKEDKSKTPPKGEPTPRQKANRPSKPNLGPEPGPATA